jgi:hypothetical protein
MRDCPTAGAIGRNAGPANMGGRILAAKRVDIRAALQILLRFVALV